jgi:hypothetical protein
MPLYDHVRAKLAAYDQRVGSFVVILQLVLHWLELSTIAGCMNSTTCKREHDCIGNLLNENSTPVGFSTEIMKVG